MKISSIAGLAYRVADLDRTVAFYESLGFRVGKRDERQATCYVNWFWVMFTVSDEGSMPGSAPTLHMKVDDLDDFYGAVLAMGLAPETEPHKQRSGREFELLDPDGYRLAFFGK
jgi:catechol 2,3-dioxygenase-like lactoylglutathione lyase family enzyme